MPLCVTVVLCCHVLTCLAFGSLWSNVLLGIVGISLCVCVALLPVGTLLPDVAIAGSACAFWVLLIQCGCVLHLRLVPVIIVMLSALGVNSFVLGFMVFTILGTSALFQDMHEIAVTEVFPSIMVCLSAAAFLEFWIANMFTELSHQLQQTRSMLDLATDGFGTVDWQTRRFTYASPELESTLKCKGLLGARLDDFLDERDVCKLQGLHKAAAATSDSNGSVNLGVADSTQILVSMQRRPSKLQVPTTSFDAKVVFSEVWGGKSNVFFQVLGEVRTLVMHSEAEICMEATPELERLPAAGSQHMVALDIDDEVAWSLSAPTLEYSCTPGCSPKSGSGHSPWAHKTQPGGATGFFPDEQSDLHGASWCPYQPPVAASSVESICGVEERIPCGDAASMQSTTTCIGLENVGVPSIALGAQLEAQQPCIPQSLASASCSSVDVVHPVGDNIGHAQENLQSAGANADVARGEPRKTSSLVSSLVVGRVSANGGYLSGQAPVGKPQARPKGTRICIKDAQEDLSVKLPGMSVSLRRAPGFVPPAVTACSSVEAAVRRDGLTREDTHEAHVLKMGSSCASTTSAESSPSRRQTISL